MKEFVFKDYNLELRIAGKDFYVECNSDVGDRMLSYSKKGLVLIDQIKAGEKTSEDALTFCSGAIDDILGQGAFEKIFEGRTPTVTDSADVLIFLSEQVAAKNQEQREPEPNREQRRTAVKKKK